MSTLFDLYGLGRDFPGVQESSGIRDPLERTTAIEARFGEVVVGEAGCRAERFLPHIQPYEFEALLFSDVARLVALESSWQTAFAALQAARDKVASPEHIDDGPLSHPSARLAVLTRPQYNKVLHGPLIAAHIGLDRIRAECAHFAAWLERLKRLTPL